MATHPGHRAALVAQTFDDGRDVMVEGESGLESVLTQRGIGYKWNRSLGQILLENGSRADIYSSEKAKQLRGPQHHVAWGDEPAYWRDAPLGDAENTTWSNLKLGLRLGLDPRCVLTTTPLPNKLILHLAAQDNVVQTVGSTYENLENLSDTFRRNVLAQYENTRLGQQELHAAILTDVPGALWTRDMIRYGDAPPGTVNGVVEPDYQRIVVSMDPATTSGEDSDESGIVVAAKGADGRGYVLSDQSGRFHPTDAAKRVIAAYDHYKADLVVAETNNGGDYIESALRAAGFTGAYRTVTATKGKRTRAQPVAGLYERGLVSHIKPFTELEDQLCNFTPDTLTSPDRLDALVWAFTELMLGAEVSGDMFISA